MKSTLAALKLLAMFSIPLFSGQVFGSDPRLPFNVYLYCYNDTPQQSAVATTPSNQFFTDFLSKYGTDHFGIEIKNAVKVDGRYLSILSMRFQKVVQQR